MPYPKIFILTTWIFLLDDNPDKIVDREPNYDCAGDEGDFAHDSYCHYYYSCQKNRVTLRECPEGKYFDIERGYCEDWYMVSCGDRLTPEGKAFHKVHHIFQPLKDTIHVASLIHVAINVMSYICKKYIMNAD